jgi:hypothetical protein
MRDKRRKKEQLKRDDRQTEKERNKASEER